MDGKPWIDPTPKRNHIFESQITGKQEIHKLVIKLTPPPQQQQQLSQF